jgi:hypothetical protein
MDGHTSNADDAGSGGEASPARAEKRMDETSPPIRAIAKKRTADGTSWSARGKKKRAGVGVSTN